MRYAWCGALHQEGRNYWWAVCSKGIFKDRFCSGGVANHIALLCGVEDHGWAHLCQFSIDRADFERVNAVIMPGVQPTHGLVALEEIIRSHQLHRAIKTQEPQEVLPNPIHIFKVLPEKVMLEPTPHTKCWLWEVKGELNQEEVHLRLRNSMCCLVNKEHEPAGNKTLE